jgi:hypothetical protein
MEDVSQKLKLYREAVVQSREKIAQIQGSTQSLMERLKTEYGVETVEDAKKLLATTESEVTKLEASVTQIIRKIEDSYSFA